MTILTFYLRNFQWLPWELFSPHLHVIWGSYSYGFVAYDFMSICPSLRFKISAISTEGKWILSLKVWKYDMACVFTGWSSSETMKGEFARHTLFNKAILELILDDSLLLKYGHKNCQISCIMPWVCFSMLIGNFD